MNETATAIRLIFINMHHAISDDTYSDVYIQTDAAIWSPVWAAVDGADAALCDVINAAFREMK